MTCALCDSTWPENHAARCPYDEEDTWEDLK